MRADNDQPKQDKVLGFGLFVIHFVATLILFAGVILFSISSFSMVSSVLRQFYKEAFYIGLCAMGAGIVVYSIGRAMCYFASIIRETNQQIYKENILKIYGLSLASELYTVVLVNAGSSLLFITIGLCIKWDQNFLFGILIWGSIFILAACLRIFTHRCMDRYQIKLENATEPDL